MIPLKDNIPSKKKPIINYTLIILNVLVFIYEISLSTKELEILINNYGFIAKKFLINFKKNKFDLEIYKIFITHMFLHGSLLHILSNLWFLYIFGDNVEDRLGRIKYLFFYITCGISAAILQSIFNINSNIPMIGASGAISGVLGAYMVFYPKAKVISLIPVILFLPIPIPAFIFILLWFIFQIINALSSLILPTSNVAWLAHVGGFIVGLKIAKRVKEKQEQKEDDIYYI